MQTLRLLPAMLPPDWPLPKSQLQPWHCGKGYGAKFYLAWSHFNLPSQIIGAAFASHAIKPISHLAGHDMD